MGYGWRDAMRVVVGSFLIDTVEWGIVGGARIEGRQGGCLRKWRCLM